MRYNYKKNNIYTLEFVRTHDVQSKDDRLSLRISSHIKAALVEFCSKENISVNSFVNALIARELQRFQVETRDPNRDVLYLTDEELGL